MKRARCLVILSVALLVCGATLVASPAAAQIYSMSVNTPNTYHDGYADSFYAWGYHALRWKAASSQVSYSPQYASGVPSSTVMFADDIPLNDNEADSCVFPQGNPPGGWGSCLAWDFKEVAVGAGMFMDRWSSPVYTNMEINGWQVPVVIRSVSFSVNNPYGANTMSALCDFWGWNAQGGDVDVEATAQACAFHEDDRYTVTSMTISYWDPNLQDTHTINGEANMAAAFPYSQYYIGDPDDASIVPRYSADVSANMSKSFSQATIPHCAVQALPAAD
jgi:hypothetical protein